MTVAATTFERGEIGDWCQLYRGDCLEVLPTLEPGGIDAVVTDPPYGLSFMGKDWDHGIPGVRFWQELLRVAKPGAHLLAFGGTRTHHRLMVAIEDAAWEIRDCVMWVYGTGFPKSLDVSKAIDKAAGAEREEVGIYESFRPNKHADTKYAGNLHTSGIITAPRTAAARKWQGWGTALKPAWEPIVLARKPLDGTVAANVQRHGTGALNIDGCRVGSESTRCPRPPGSLGRMNDDGWQPKPGVNGSELGRWPANLIHDGSDKVLAGFPDVGKSSGGRAGHEAAYGGGYKQDYYGDAKPGLGDSGSAARFFYCAKASKADRDEGLGDTSRRQQDEGRKKGRPGGDNPRNRGVHPRANNHPTVKPTALMQYLVRLVTPPGGTVLDPFMGSGSTGKACAHEGLRFVGIELSADYLKLAQKRIAKAAQQPSMF